MSLSAFDLPYLRSQPTYDQLVEALQELEIKPTTWGQSDSLPLSQPDAAINRYLLSIVSNKFDWFEDVTDHTGQCTPAEEQKETLWDLASKRMAERCGRSAMPEMKRLWVVPASTKTPEYTFEIREPPLTGDNLGHKTWGTSFAIAKKLEEFGTEYFHGLLKGGPQDMHLTLTGESCQRPRAKVLELGSGTGLVGIAAGAIWATDVILTDLKEIQGNLIFNIQKNSSVNPNGGDTSAEVLDWMNPDEALSEHESKKFEIILATDSLYDNEHPFLVATMIKKFLKNNTTSRALVAVPMRDLTTKSLAKMFKDSMREYDFKLLHQGWEDFRDDWEGVDEECAKCWWGIFCPGLSFVTPR